MAGLSVFFFFFTGHSRSVSLPWKPYEWKKEWKGQLSAYIKIDVPVSSFSMILWLFVVGLYVELGLGGLLKEFGVLDQCN